MRRFLQARSASATALGIMAVNIAPRAARLLPGSPRELDRVSSVGLGWRRVALAVGLVVAGSLAGGGVAQAALTDRGGAFHGCAFARAGCCG